MHAQRLQQERKRRKVLCARSQALSGGFQHLNSSKRGRVGAESICTPFLTWIAEGGCKRLSATGGMQLVLPFWVLLWTQYSCHVQSLCQQGPCPVPRSASACPSTQGFLEKVRNITDSCGVSSGQGLRSAGISGTTGCQRGEGGTYPKAHSKLPAVF